MLKNVLTLVDSEKNRLNITMGLGELKGKSTLKVGMELKDKAEEKF